MSMESIHGAPIVPPTLPQVRPSSTPERDVHGSDSGGAASNHVGTPADRSRVSLQNTDAAPSLELPPAGVDPELWSVLTGEERQFFSVSAEMGPVTYGREHTARHETALPRGGRLDVRV